MSITNQTIIFIMFVGLATTMAGDCISTADWTLADWEIYRDVFWDDSYTAQPEIWGPAQIVDNLPYATSADTTKIANILASSHFTEPYNYMTFACDSSSEIVWYLLTNAGYDTKLMVGTVGNYTVPHAWVMVKFDRGYIPIETTGSYETRLGTIVGLKETICFGKGNTYTSQDYLRGVQMNSSQEYNVFFDHSKYMYSAIEYELEIERND